MKHWFGRCSQVSFIVVLTLCRVMNGAVAAPLPGGFEHSGWYQFELVVMVDARAEVLASETWPLDHLRSLPRPLALASRSRAQSRAHGAIRIGRCIGQPVWTHHGNAA